MSKHTQHSDSPLHLQHYFFEHIECHASTKENAGGSLELSTKREFTFDEEDPCKADVSLTIKFAPADEEAEPSYTGSIKIIGKFVINEDFDKSKHEALIRVTACSILYGAARELLANFTARSSQGLLTLPSVSFRKSKHQEE